MECDFSGWRKTGIGVKNSRLLFRFVKLASTQDPLELGDALVADGFRESDIKIDAGRDAKIPQVFRLWSGHRAFY